MEIRHIGDKKEDFILIHDYCYVLRFVWDFIYLFRDMTYPKDVVEKDHVRNAIL